MPSCAGHQARQGGASGRWKGRLPTCPLGQLGVRRCCRQQAARPPREAGPDRTQHVLPGPPPPHTHTHTHTPPPAGVRPSSPAGRGCPGRPSSVQQAQRARRAQHAGSSMRGGGATVTRRWPRVTRRLAPPCSAAPGVSGRAACARKPPLLRPAAAAPCPACPAPAPPGAPAARGWPPPWAAPSPPLHTPGTWAPPAQGGGSVAAWLLLRCCARACVVWAHARRPASTVGSGRAARRVQLQRRASCSGGLAQGRASGLTLPSRAHPCCCSETGRNSTRKADNTEERL